MKEQNIQDTIVDYLNSIPMCLAYTTTTKGRVVGRKRIPAKRQERKGKSDVVCCYYGYYIAIEVKKPGEKQSEDQKKFAKDVILAGGYYWLAESIDDILANVSIFNHKLKE